MIQTTGSGGDLTLSITTMSAVLRTNRKVKLSKGNKIQDTDMGTRDGDGEDPETVEVTSSHIGLQDDRSVGAMQTEGMIISGTAKIAHIGTIVRAAGTGVRARTLGLDRAHGPHHLARTRVTNHRDIATDPSPPETPLASESLRAAEKVQAGRSDQSACHLHLSLIRTLSKQ